MGIVGNVNTSRMVMEKNLGRGGLMISWLLMHSIRNVILA